MTHKASERFGINWQMWAVIVAVLGLIVPAAGVTASQHWWPFTRSQVAVANANERARERELREREQREHEERKTEEERGSGETAPRSPARLGWLSTIPNPSRTNINEVNSHPVTVGGRTYAHTVQLVQLNSNCNSPTDPSTVSFPVPPGATHLSGMFGWTSDSNGSSADLIVYADSPTGKVLWDHPFSNPGLPLMFKHLDKIAGAHAVIFELVGQQCDNGTFVLAETKFTS